MPKEPLSAEEQAFAERLKPMSAELVIENDNDAQLIVHTVDYSAHEQNVDLLHEMEDHCGLIAENYRRLAGHDGLYEGFDFKPGITSGTGDLTLHIQEPHSIALLKRIMIAAGKENEIQDATMPSRFRPDGEKPPIESGDANSQGSWRQREGEAE